MSLYSVLVHYVCIYEWVSWQQSVQKHFFVYKDFVHLEDAFTSPL